MDESGMTEGLAHAEALMIEGQNDEALSVLLGIAEDAEEYVDRNCPTTDEVQWFSFPTIFERLAYRRVEKDPRELRDVGEPMDRLYGDLALAAVHTGDYDIATNALKQAVSDGVKQFISVEMSNGQMINDVKLAIDCQRPVTLINRMGGNVPSVEEIVKRAKEQIGGTQNA